MTVEGEAASPQVDFLHVVSYIDKANRANFNLLLPSYVTKPGTLSEKSEFYAPRDDDGRILKWRSDPKGRNHDDHVMYIELHKYYLNFGPPEYKELWDRYLAE